MRRILLEYWRVLPFRDLQTNIEIMQVKNSFIRAHLLLSNAIHFSITTKRGC